MTDFPALWVNSKDGETPAYDADMLRMFFAAILDNLDSSLNITRPGRLAGLYTSLTGSSSVRVTPGVGVVAHDNSTYWVLVPSTETVDIPAAHATYERKDLVVLQMGGDGPFGGRLSYLTGEASAKPAYPSTSGLILAYVRVPTDGAPRVYMSSAHVFLRGTAAPLSTGRYKGVTGKITASRQGDEVTISFRDVHTAPNNTWIGYIEDINCRGSFIVGNKTDMYPVYVSGQDIRFAAAVPESALLQGTVTVPVVE